MISCPSRSKTTFPTSLEKRSAVWVSPTVSSRKNPGVSAEKIRKLREGDFDDDAVERAAPVLNLDAAALRKLASGKWKPETIGEIDGLAQFNTTYGDMTVNAYLVWDPATREAVAFDTGADCGGMLQRIEQEKSECETDSADPRASGPRG